MKKRKVLFIDNFDSFTYNLVDDFCKRNCQAKVYRSDTPLNALIDIYKSFKPDLLVISPGPGCPKTAGVTLKAIEYFNDKLPIFGVCLGHQSIVEYFGGKTGHAPLPMHGKPSRVNHKINGLFENIENPLQAGRYHSLCSQDIPDCLNITAEFEGIAMGIQHKTLPIYGVQFHPESILTPSGGKIIENILKIAENYNSK